MPAIHDLLTLIRDENASDLHLLEGVKPKIRKTGELVPLEDHPTLDEEQMKEYLYGVITDEQIQTFEETGDLDFAYSLEGVARFRCNYYKHINGRGALFRLIPTEVKTIEDLHLPPITGTVADMRSGLVLITGPTGSGKSTTLAAIVHRINLNYRKHIITIEDPIVFAHKNIQSVILQREVGTHTESFAAALRAAVRQDPDVILVGEMRDLETIGLALTAAELGLLVLGTLHTNSAAHTIDRIVDVFPARQQSQIRTMLSESLQGIFSQLLLKTADGTGRIAAVEVLMRRGGLGNMIREGATNKIVSLIETSRSEGMQLIDHALMQLLIEGTIDGDTAYMKATNKQAFEEYRSKEEEVVV